MLSGLRAVRTVSLTSWQAGPTFSSLRAPFEERVEDVQDPVFWMRASFSVTVKLTSWSFCWRPADLEAEGALD